MGTFNLTDRDLMSFGRHKGKQLRQVPDDYLIYIYNKGWTTGPIKEYIETHLYDKIDKTDEKGVEL